jgi:hypothetical protein
MGRSYLKSSPRRLSLLQVVEQYKATTKEMERVDGGRW